MKTVLALAVSVALLGGCSGSMISVDAIDDSITTVSKRHDDYVSLDAALTPEQKATYLRTTQLLRAVLEEAKAGKK